VYHEALVASTRCKGNSAEKILSNIIQIPAVPIGWLCNAERFQAQLCLRTTERCRFATLVFATV